jgi:hypothetical protein
LTVDTGREPPTPSAMAFRTSASTTYFEPTLFTAIPFMALSLPEAYWACKFLKAKVSDQTLRSSSAVCAFRSSKKQSGAAITASNEVRTRR